MKAIKAVSSLLVTAVLTSLCAAWDRNTYVLAYVRR